MKKAVTFIGACALALAVFCGCSWSADKGSDDNFNNNGTTTGNEGTHDGNDKLPPDYGYGDKHIHGEVNELLTVEELVDFHLNGARYPENFVFRELEGYGRVIESASSQEDALEVAAEHFISGWCTTVECRLTVETDLFYGLYVKWDYRSGGVGEPVAYYDEYVVSFKKDVYDFENKQFFTENADIIKSILNYSCYDHVYISPEYLGFAEKIYSSDIIKNGDKYEFTAYGLTVVGGDWGIQDKLYFLKLVVEIDLATGKTSYNVETVGRVYIDGKYTHCSID